MHDAQVIPLPRGRVLNSAPVHVRPRIRQATVTELHPTAEPARQQSLADKVSGFLRRRLTGAYPVDDFGFDPDLTDAAVMPALRLIFEKWFRVEVTGAVNLLSPTPGALIVANHSGTVPWDAAMTAIAVHDHHPNNKHLRMLGADLVFKLPVLGSLARATGQTLATRSDAERLLRAGELVGVWPEGFKGIGKPFSERYQLQRFGRGGFVTTAINARVPIIPCSIVGAEEIYPKIADLKPLARALGLPYFPITPFFPLLGPLGAIPLPTKWRIDFGTPIRTDRQPVEAVEDHSHVLAIADHVRNTIQQNLNDMLAKRESVFWG